MRYKIYEYPNYRTITYEIVYKGRQFLGVATCCKDDEPYYNTMFGTSLARMKAEVKLHDYKRKEAAVRKQTLSAAYNFMTREEQQSLGGKRLARQITGAQTAIDIEKEQVESIKAAIKRYTENKDKFNVWYDKNKAKK